MSRNLSPNVAIVIATVGLAAVFCLSALSTVVEAAGIGPNPVDPGGSLPTNSRLVFQNPRGLHRYYAFFFSMTSATLSYRYSSDAVKWSDPQFAIPGGSGSAGVWVHDSGMLLIVHAVASGTVPGSIVYRRGTISDFVDPISWTQAQTVEPGGTNAGSFGLSITRTANGRPVITAVSEISIGGTYRYEVRAWGANADSATPVWTRASVIPSFTSLAQRQSSGFTSAYSSTGNYVFIAGSAARALKSVGSPFDVSWVRASWDGVSWSVGTVTLLLSTQPVARPCSLVIDDVSLPSLLVIYSQDLFAYFVHYHGTVQDGTRFETFSVAGQIVTSATLSIDLTSTPRKLKAIYHYGASNIYWKETQTSPISWGAENTVAWSDDTTNLASSQRAFVGRTHALAESSHGVFYLNI